MGSLCSNIEKDDAPGEKDGQAQRRTSKSLTRQSSKRLQKKISHRLRRQRNQSTPPQDDFLTRHQADMDMAEKMIAAQDEVIRNTLGAKDVPRAAVPDKFDNVDAFMRYRQEMQRREGTISFDFTRTALATEKEIAANDKLKNLMKADDDMYAAAAERVGWGGQKHKRFAGDHFLSNVDLIEKTKLYRVATKMPKGAHLHIHFNACLKPNVLLDIAKTMDRMFISSSKSLAPPGDGVAEEAAKTALDSCEIQFQIWSITKEKKREEDQKREQQKRNEERSKNGDRDETEQERGDPFNVFSPTYVSGELMLYAEFLAQFRRIYPDRDPEQWLASKLVFHEEEAHNHLQTVKGAWVKFDGRTKMMKGLFNYDKAYRAYTQGLLDDFVRDNIQYAEIRPNFMQTNQVWKNDGSEQIENDGIMKLIIEEYEAFQKRTNDYFGGMKVIYCTPRSFEPEKVQFALNQCLEFKVRWPQWIAGFDLVGEEAKGKPLKAFISEFLQFREDCDLAGHDIPFLFHCGETNEIGGDTDGNLLDALLLNSKRIGHGFALARHPYIMEHMKKRGICLEVCPISNEQLGLTPRIGNHSMYNLLANNVHCTVNSDNGTLFRSSLSHDFYQVMVGKSDMTLHGWRQLIEWSLDHSCMSRGDKDPKDNELAAVRAKWLERWEVFIDWINTEYAAYKTPEDKKASA